MQVSDKLKNLLLIIIFFLPLITSFRSFGYEQIKVLFFILSISLIGFLWRGKGFKWTLISKIAGVFILALCLTSITGINPTTSFLGDQPYFQGVILYSYLYLFYLMVKTFKIEPKKYVLVVVASASIVSFLAIKDWILLNLFNVQITSYAGRVVSTFGQPNFYAGFLLLSLPFSYLLFKNENKRLRLLGWGSGLISLVGIMVSYSRSAILLALILFSLALSDQLKMKKSLIAVFAIISMTVLFSVNFSAGFVWQEFLKPLSTNNPDLTKESVEKRVYIWPVAWQLILQRPFLGYGLENINQALSGYFQTNKHSLFEENLKISPILISLKDLNIDRTHNYILDLLLSSGILGLLAWIFLILMLLKKILQSKVNPASNTLLVGFITYLLWIQFQNQSVVHLVYFWLLAGLIDS